MAAAKAGGLTEAMLLSSLLGNLSSAFAVSAFIPAVLRAYYRYKNANSPIFLYTWLIGDVINLWGLFSLKPQITQYILAMIYTVVDVVFLFQLVWFGSDDTGSCRKERFAARQKKYEKEVDKDGHWLKWNNELSAWDSTDHLFFAFKVVLAFLAYWGTYLALQLRSNPAYVIDIPTQTSVQAAALGWTSSTLFALARGGEFYKGWRNFHRSKFALLPKDDLPDRFSTRWPQCFCRYTKERKKLDDCKQAKQQRLKELEQLPRPTTASSDADLQRLSKRVEEAAEAEAKSRQLSLCGIKIHIVDNSRLDLWAPAERDDFRQESGERPPNMLYQKYWKLRNEKAHEKNSVREEAYIHGVFLTKDEALISPDQTNFWQRHGLTGDKITSSQLYSIAEPEVSAFPFTAMFCFLILDNVFQLASILVLSNDPNYIRAQLPWIFGPSFSLLTDFLLWISALFWWNRWSRTSVAAVEAARARAQKAQSDYRRAIILEEEKESIIGEISREYKKQKAGENEKSGRFERDPVNEKGNQGHERSGSTGNVKSEHSPHHRGTGNGNSSISSGRPQRKSAEIPPDASRSSLTLNDPDTAAALRWIINTTNVPKVPPRRRMGSTLRSAHSNRSSKERKTADGAQAPSCSSSSPNPPPQTHHSNSQHPGSSRSDPKKRK